MLDILSVLSPNSVDSIVTDPPYELGFMGKGWDNSGIAFQSDTWHKCLEVLKPGGYLLAFGGSRTFHRIACAIEDGGFEIRDVIMWIYGSGFPKSMDIAKAIESKLTLGSANTQDFKKLNGTKVESGNLGFSKQQFLQGARPNDYGLDKHLRTDKVEYTTDEAIRWNGWGTALKPAYEPIIVARKPCEGSATENVLKYGVGVINIDECRVGTEIIGGGTMPSFRDVGKKSKESIGIDKLSFGQVQNAERVEYGEHEGRFPSNVILTYDETDEQEVCDGMITDEGNVSRYFYCAKASKKDRDEGLDTFPTVTKVFNGTSDQSSEDMKDVEKRFTTDGKNMHPTVKPCDLMQYLVRLVTPKGGTVLDPFNGSGSTGKAVMYENREKQKDYKYIGIELTEQYLPIAKARIEYAQNIVIYEVSDNTLEKANKQQKRDLDRLF